MSRLQIENILGYTASYNILRASRSGNEFLGLIPAPDFVEQIVKRDATVEETVAEMKKLIKKYNWQTRELSKRLLGKDINDTCRKIWSFLFDHIKYCEDSPGREELRTPALSWYLRTIRGIDCFLRGSTCLNPAENNQISSDDFSIFAGCILYNLGIPFYLRIAKYKKNYFQHVYVVVPGIKEHYFVVDAVLDKYDLEKEPSEIIDFLVMDKTNLNGINVSVLSGIGDDISNELEGILNGDDFAEMERMEGLGEIPDEETGLNAIRNYLIRTRTFAKRNPHMIRAVEDPKSFLGMVDYALKYWHTPHREKALSVLAREEQRQNILNGVGNFAEGYEDTGLFYGLDGINGVSVLGKAKSPKGFFKKVAQAVKTVKKKVDTAAVKIAPKPLKKVVQKVIDTRDKVSQKAVTVAKKVAKQIVRFDPAVLTIRAGILAALKTNVFKMAERLKLGYLTEEEAKTHGFNMDQWAKARKVLKDSENLFVNVYQGKPEAFRNAILTGRAGGLGTVYTMEEAEEMNGLGVYATAAAAGGATTVAASATPWIKKVLELMKNVDWGKLIQNVSAAFLNRKKKKAEKQNEQDNAEQTNVEQSSSEPSNESSDNTQSTDTELPRDQNSEPVNDKPEPEEKTTAIPEEDEPSGASGGDTIRPKQGSEGDSKDSGTEDNITYNSNPSNLPDTKETKLPAEKTGANARGEVEFFDKAKDWMSENKVILLTVAGGLAFAYTAYRFNKSRKGLAGTGKKGKSNKGKNKKNPPHIAGIGKRKGKGGTPNVKI